MTTETLVKEAREAARICDAYNTMVLADDGRDLHLGALLTRLASALEAAPPSAPRGPDRGRTMSMDFEAWRCCHNDKLLCPEEGCPTRYGCARDHGWQPGDSETPEQRAIRTIKARATTGGKE